MKAKHESITEELINTMAMDIWRYLVNHDNFETNQQYLGFRALFRGYVVKNWNEIDFSIKRFRKCNKVLIKSIFVPSFTNFSSTIKQSVFLSSSGL